MEFNEAGQPIKVNDSRIFAACPGLNFTVACDAQTITELLQWVRDKNIIPALSPPPSSEQI